MAAIALLLVLLMPDGSVITQARRMSDTATCEASLVAALEAASRSAGIIDAAGACFHAKLDPRRQPPA